MFSKIHSLKDTPCSMCESAKCKWSVDGGERLSDSWRNANVDDDNDENIFKIKISFTETQTVKNNLR